MENTSQTIEYKGKKYKLVCDMNAMEEIQEEYGSFAKWGELTYGSEGEPNIKAIKFGFTAMLNEGIDIDNEENGTKEKPLTLKQVGRIITEIGFTNSAEALNKTVAESTKSEEKNA